ncbi:outer membrane autotransporter barrel domain-containing protein [Bartonella vinsonii subsp. arupensis Pm136co]|uniref:Outer membrane autotransporter barrel domain-containing protein n=2 Tax=Bartonella vinsonii subsp. arupensis TaxID=110578 RepID=A0ABP2QV42_BARVI|nr:BafA family autotransporter [Bartonella vinsonii]EJF98772.1 outer membrane autotransporter barrel domain-containing protein [Bartonella vinsonii subsp. arupensis Pm136co]
MQHKLILGFWALMTSSFVLKIASAEGETVSRERPLMAVCVSKNLEETGKNLVSENFIIKDGQVETVVKGKFLTDTLIEEYGLQSVEYGGQTQDTIICGGEQIVLGEGSSAYNTEIHGKGETVGQQNVYDDGVAFFANVMSGGEQNLSTWLGDKGGVAVDTKVYAAGVQNVFTGSKANTVTLEDGALQRVHAGGYVNTLMINSGANSLIYSGAILEGEVKVNGTGKLHLYAGDKGQQTKVEEIILKGKESQLHSIATEVDGSSSLIGKLSGEGSVIYTSISTGSTELNPYYSLLHIDDLSGNIDFIFRANFAGGHGDYLFIEKGTGNHTVSVMDAGTEIINASFSSLDLITDKSGGAYFTLKNNFGEKADAVDGGAYMYDLKQKDYNGGKIWYLAISEKPSTFLIIPPHTILPIAETFENEKDKTVSKNAIVSSHTSDFSVSEDKFVLQNFLLNDDRTVYIWDDGETEGTKFSINNTVEGSGTLYVEAGGFSENTTVGNGGSEVVAEQGISKSTIVYEGGRQSVEGGGTAIDTEIYGGNQLVFGEGDVNDGVVSSTAYSTKIYGQGDALGQQSVYDDGVVSDTKIMRGGVQNLAKWFADDDDFALKSGGLAMNTEIFEGGIQRVLAGGEADIVTLYDGAVQIVHAGGYVKNLTINGGANSWIFSGAILGEKITVNNLGQLNLYAGDDKFRTTVEEITLSGEESKLYSIANISDGRSSYIQNLSGAGKVIFASADSHLYYSQFYIDNLSGSLHFNFNVSLAEGKGDYLFINNGSGYHTISVKDSGLEITDPSSKSLDIIVDKSGRANFTLQNFSGANVKALDGGTYIYGLKQREGDDEDEKIWYLAAVYIDNIPRGRRTPRHLSHNQTVSFLSTIPALRDQAPEVVRSADQHHFSEEREQSVVSANAQSFTDQILLRPSNKNKLSSQLSEELLVSDFLTTPSTDAVLSLSVTPALVFKNELQTVRAGRGILERNKKTSALWTYAIKSKENVSADHIDFKLEQTGIILGIGGLNELAHGEFSIGGFGSYDKARVTHARGGVSNINTYGIGAYATYFDHSGWYLDSVLKYNHYQNTLNAVSTNGLAIEGNYNQWAVGTSFEAGYRMKVAQSSWIQPYVQLTWLQVEGKEIKLSNDMTGEINPFMSLRSEVGLSVGYEFLDGVETSLMGYITAAWLRENKDDNHTTINKQHQFVTDLSGNAGKLGIGLSSFLSDKLKLYAEAHYVKGHKTKQSLQGILGVRYSF